MHHLHARWLLGMYDYMLNSGDFIRKGFKIAGIDDAINLELVPEDPFEDLKMFKKGKSVYTIYQMTQKYT